MSVCSHCGSEFSCAMQDQRGGAPCWCTKLPKLALTQMPAAAVVENGTATCLCPACLKRWVDSQIPSDKATKA